MNPMNFRISLGDWATQRADAESVRHDVFIIEQHVPVELELDEMDPVSLHAVAHDDSGKAIGTGRLLPDGHIGRMAVVKDKRNTGVGGAILAALMQESRSRAHTAVMLNAQTQVQSFYERHGFAKEGDEFMDAGIPHVQMRRTW